MGLPLLHVLAEGEDAMTTDIQMTAREVARRVLLSDGSDPSENSPVFQQIAAMAVDVLESLRQKGIGQSSPRARTDESYRRVMTSLE